MIEKEKLESYLYLIEQAQREAERLAIQSSAISNYNFTVNASLSPGILQWKGIEATRELATSQNAKMVIMGNGNQGLPVILNAGDMPVSDDSVNRLSQPATDEN
jgi:regulator of protease activity HflC (stomatin/prohibitin superfamily)